MIRCMGCQLSINKPLEMPSRPKHISSLFLSPPSLSHSYSLSIYIHKYMCIYICIYIDPTPQLYQDETQNQFLIRVSQV